MKNIKGRIKAYSTQLSKIPLIILLALSILTISSYWLAGWLMHPIADDYSSLVAYHTDHLLWLRDLPHTVITGGGRYAQTVVAVSMYGALGARSLQLTAFLSVGLFLLAAYVAILAWQSTRGSKYDHRLAGAGAALLFLFYSSLSVTFSWVNGGIDNSFQDFLWLPGFITYTLPLELILLITALVVIHRDPISRHSYLLLPIGFVAFCLGTFSEMLPILYAEAVCLYAIYALAQRYPSLGRLRSGLKRGAPFLIMSAGLLVGLAFNYLSAATTERQAKIGAHVSILQAALHAQHAARQYFSLYVFGGTAGDHTAIVFVVIGSILTGLLMFHRLAFSPTRQALARLIALLALLTVMTFSAVFVCFVLIYKGTGLTSYLVPRLEIIYNFWLCLALVTFGLLSSQGLKFLFNRFTLPRATMPIILLTFTLALLACTPSLLNHATSRLRSVAVFSAAWQERNNTLVKNAQLGIKNSSVPLVDIGDTYYPTCQNHSDSWLSQAEESYYRLPYICFEKNPGIN